MRKVFTIVLVLLLLFYLIPHVNTVLADYTLPYPSYMPGNKFYWISRLVDRFGKNWYWGNIAKFKYNLKLSDKYLVEAKTLFEYKQYLLALDALHRADKSFASVSVYLFSAKKENKDITVQRNLAQEASLEHQHVLTKLSKELPEHVLWTPEKSESSTLLLKENIYKAIQIRMDAYNAFELL